MPEKIDTEELQVIAFEIIFHSGNARTMIHEAFSLMRKKEYNESEKKLEEANTEIITAHHSQTNLLKDYASGKKIEMEIIMVHAQDHLMTTMTLLEIAKEMEFLYQTR